MDLLWAVGRIVLLCYVALLLLLFFAQASLIFPGSVTRGQPSAAVDPPAGTELLSLKTRRGEDIAALFGAALTPDGKPLTDGGSRPTLLYFYGNGSNLKYCDWEFDHFRRLGANVLIPEYAGYGMSSGKAGEQGCYAAADAAYAHLLERRDIDPGRIVAAGHSLGGAVAIDLASRKPLAGAAAFCAFTSMVEMAARQYPWVPAPLLLRHRFENDRKVPRVRCPLLLVDARGDALIPGAMSDRLARAAGGPVTRLTIEAGHNDLFLAGEAEVLKALEQLLKP